MTHRILVVEDQEDLREIARIVLHGLALLLGDFQFEQPCLMPLQIGIGGRTWRLTVCLALVSDVTAPAIVYASKRESKLYAPSVSTILCSLETTHHSSSSTPHE
jgi:hypothetical protein